MKDGVATGSIANTEGRGDHREARGVRIHVLDADGPPGVAFIRSLGARGVTVAASSHMRLPAGRVSRHVSSFERSPSVYDTDTYISWLAARLSDGSIGLVAPTSDYVAFAVAAARDQLGMPPQRGMPSIEKLWSALHKPEFGDVMEAIGFPTIPYELPVTVEEALAAAERLGYPVVLKPRTHIGVGLHRGGVVRNPDELARQFVAHDVASANATASLNDPFLGWPMLQKFLDEDQIDVVSIAGCLDANGDVLGLGISRKLAQWPPRVGIGTLFEVVHEAPFVDQAINAARATLGTGLFEIEICVDRLTGDAWPIDLNPRAYGQIRLEIARGIDLPGHWYSLATGLHLDPIASSVPAPEVWRAGTTYHLDSIANIVRGPKRWSTTMAHLKTRRRPTIGSMLDWSDPLPSAVLAASQLMNPRNLVRPFLRR